MPWNPVSESSGAPSGTEPFASQGEGGSVSRTDDNSGDDLPAHDLRTQAISVVPELAPAPSEPWTDPTEVGRYRVLAPIAQGGMGVVYRAFDPELARPVALKLLRPEKVVGQSSLELRRRFLQREAQALARVSHPNVIAVHDVGIWNGQVFVAMELVEGLTLREWLTQVRSRRDLLQVFEGAGQGLAAAHRAGLIHRDFKPSNVLVGTDDRPRVLDFGLARAPETSLLESASDVPSFRSEAGADGEASQDLLDTPLTVVGQVVGTPAYMSPEQQRGQMVDARTDQFSFCVTLYEALLGERPFPARAFRREQRPPKPDFSSRRGRLSPRLRKILLRGLEADPADRFASMDALLVELRKELGQGRRRLAALAATAMLTAGAVWIPASRAEDPGAACVRSRAAIESAWNATVKNDVKRAFLATGLPYAADTYDRVATVFDGYVEDWATMRQNACEATHVHGVQSSELLDRRTRCLDRAHGELVALTGILGESLEPRVVDKAVAAAYGLPDLTRCADSEALLAAHPPPVAKQRAAVEAADTLLDRAAAARMAGQTQEAFEAANSALARAQPLAHPPLLARAHYLVGSLQAELGQYDVARTSLAEAAHVAAIAHEDLLTAEAWTRLFDVVAVQQAHPEQAEFIEDAARQWIVRAGSPLRVEIRWLETKGHIAFWRGDFADAERQYRAEVDIIRERLGGKDPALAIAYNSVGAAVASQGRYADASAVFQQAMDLGAEVLGPGHPWVALVTTNLGLLHQRIGNLEQARTLHERALATYEAVYGEQHRRVALVLINLGAVFMAQGDYAAAEEAARRSVDIVDAVDGPDHPDLGNRLVSLAEALIKRSRWQEAREAAQRSLAVNDKNGRQEHPDYAYPLLALGEVEQGQGNLADAEDYYRRALAVREQSEGHTPELLANLYLSLANVRHQRGDQAEAEALLERARRTTLDGLGSTHANLARIDGLLGAIRRDAGRMDDAVRLHEKNLAALRSEYAPDHSFVALAEIDLGETLLAMNDARAEALFEHARNSLAPDHPSYPAALLGMGRAILARGDAQAVASLLEPAMEQGGGWPPALRADVAFTLAQAMWRIGDRAPAQAMARQAEALARTAQGSEADTGEIRAWLARPH